MGIFSCQLLASPKLRTSFFLDGLVRVFPLVFSVDSTVPNVATFDGILLAIQRTFALGVSFHPQPTPHPTTHPTPKPPPTPKNQHSILRPPHCVRLFPSFFNCRMCSSEDVICVVFVFLVRLPNFPAPLIRHNQEYESIFLFSSLFSACPSLRKYFPENSGRWSFERFYDFLLVRPSCCDVCTGSSCDPPLREKQYLPLSRKFRLGRRSSPVLSPSNSHLRTF